MNKIIIAFIGFISIVALIFVGSYSYLKHSSPLVTNSIGYQMGKKVVIVEVGNENSFGNIEIKEVLVNNEDNPSTVKVQVSNHSKGFIISDNYDSEEARKYTFKDLENVQLEPNTDPQEQLNKVNDGTITDGGLFYAVSIGHHSSIEQVIIKYQYLGLSYEKTVTID